MKTLIKAISIATVVLSMNTFASTAIESLSIETIKQKLTPAQIEQVMNQWKANQLANLEIKAQAISDQASIEVRREYVKQQIDLEYKRTLNALGL